MQRRLLQEKMIRWLVIIIGISVFAFIAHKLIESELYLFDTFWGSKIRSIQSQSLTKVMVFFTFFGNIKPFLIITVIISSYFLFIKRTSLAILFFFNVIGVWWLNEGIKSVFKRERPGLEHLVDATGYSFPSGHAMISTALYGFLGYLLCTYLKQKNRGFSYVAILFILFILFISLSRVYLGVHYMSDITAGMATGAVWLMMIITVYQKLRKRRI